MRHERVDASSAFDEAVRLFFAGQIEQANRLCLGVIKGDPHHFDAVRLLGVTFGQLGRHADALPFLEAVALARPADSESQLNLSATLVALRRYRDALPPCDRALALDPDYAQAHYVRGKILLALSQLDEALACLARATALKPDFVQALATRGALLYDCGRFDDAIACFDLFLRLHPDCADTIASRGDALYALERYPEALDSYDRAIAIRPGLALVHVQRGNILYVLSRFDEALRAYDRALVAAPNLPLALSNRANTLRELARFDEAAADLDTALSLVPDDAAARFNRAHLRLLTGRIAEGFEDYESRKTVQNRSFRAFMGAEWSHVVPGETVLVHTEQGLGDTIQFARFAQRLVRAGAEVVLEVQPQLARLLQTLEDVRVVGRGEALPAFDAHIQIMSLPRALGLTLEGLGQAAYLKAEPARVEAWVARLPAGRFRIGIAWQGSVHGLTDRGRSFPLSAFAPLAEHPGVTLVSLQKNFGQEQRKACALGQRIHALGETFDDGPDAFLDTAAVMKHLDLVVTSDTSIAHLAGALGRPVWIALQHVPNWRWLLERDDCPWYPTARLFRQRHRGDWAGVFDQIAAALPGAIADRAGPAAFTPLASSA